MKSEGCTACTICSWLLVLGGLQLGLMGFFGIDLFSLVTGSSEGIVRVLEILVGVAAVGVIAKRMGWCKNCKKAS